MGLSIARQLINAERPSVYPSIYSSSLDLGLVRHYFSVKCLFRFIFSSGVVVVGSGKMITLQGLDHLDRPDVSI